MFLAILSTIKNYSNSGISFSRLTDSNKVPNLTCNRRESHTMFIKRFLVKNFLNINISLKVNTAQIGFTYPVLSFMIAFVYISKAHNSKAAEPNL